MHTQLTKAAARLPRAIAVLALACLVAGGCSKVEPPRFHLNMQDYLLMMPSHDPEAFRITGREEVSDLEDKQTRIEGLQLLATAIHAAFGTPDEPYLFEEVRWNPEEKTGLDLAKIDVAAGPAGGDARGQQRGLYRQHCAHCHGISGDGAGPTATFLNPYPRDYRQGKFKFKSTDFAAKPTTADLRRTLVEGIPGTAMPSFALLPGDEIDALVEYVKYLAVRGETERNLAAELFVQDGELEPTRSGILELALEQVVASWDEADEKVIYPPPRQQEIDPIKNPKQWQASVAEGRRLFQTATAKCASCHGPTGLGDGWDVDPEAVPYDDWNKEKVVAGASYTLLPPQKLRPRNLRLGVYRGGRRPVDLYRRIHAGIVGSQMPQFGPAPGQPATLKPEEIWHLVDYVRSLPYEPESGLAEADAVAHRARQ